MVDERVEARSRRATHEYPRDRFDDMNRVRRVGVHRVTPRPKHFWAYLLTGLLGFAILTTLGILWVQSVGSITENPLAQRSETVEAPPVQAMLDPEATVMVLDSTPEQELGIGIDEAISSEGWGDVIFTGPASAEEIVESYVAYAAPNDEASALGLAEKLGGLPVKRSEEFRSLDARLVVVVGANYQGPGSGIEE